MSLRYQVQTGSRAHSASFPECKETAHLHLLPRLGMLVALPPLPLYDFIVWCLVIRAPLHFVCTLNYWVKYLCSLHVFHLLGLMLESWILSGIPHNSVFRFLWQCIRIIKIRVAAEDLTLSMLRTKYLDQKHLPFQSGSIWHLNSLKQNVSFHFWTVAF